MASLPITIVNYALPPTLDFWNLPLVSSPPLAPSTTYNPTGYAASHEPIAICVDQNGTHYLLSANGKMVSITSGLVQTTILATSSARTCVAVDASGNIYAFNASGSEVLKYTSSGGGPTIFVSGLGGATSMFFDSLGNLLVAGYTSQNVLFSVTSGGIKTTVVPSIGSATDAIYGIALDSSGNYYFFDLPSVGANPTVLKYSSSGTYIGTIGTIIATAQGGSLTYDPVAGNFYAVLFNNAGGIGAYQMTPSGTVTNLSSGSTATFQAICGPLAPALIPVVPDTPTILTPTGTNYPAYALPYKVFQSQ